MRLRITALSVVLLGVFIGALPAAAAPGQYQAPRKYYLALGDSLAYGYQPNFDFTDGYVQDFSSLLNAIKPVTTFNFGCPGETTDTYFVGCASQLQPHDTYQGSQSAAAIAFLQSHPGQVSPITIDLGGNDVVDALRACLLTASPGTCISGALPGVEQHIALQMNAILHGLRENAPRSEMLVLTYYNPYAALGNALLTAVTDQVVAGLNAAIQGAADANGAILADAYVPFNVVGPLCGSATAPVLAWGCSATNPFSLDIHPTSAGYQVIADQFWAASGYGQLD